MFGEYSAKTSTKAATVYADTWDGIKNDTVTFYVKGSIPNCDCACGENTFACTCPGSGGILLCNEYWRAPLEKAEDSQIGTIIHEMTHWFGTDDNAYGCEKCTKLAKTDRAEACNNADSFEYYTEFTYIKKKACDSKKAGSEWHLLASLLTLSLLIIVSLKQRFA